MRHVVAEDDDLVLVSRLPRQPEEEVLARVLEPVRVPVDLPLDVPAEHALALAGKAVGYLNSVLSGFRRNGAP